MLIERLPVHEDIVEKLEGRIARLLEHQQQLQAENVRLRRAQKGYLEERRRCRRELDAVLDKVDKLSRGGA